MPGRDLPHHEALEGVARVVDIDGTRVWLEPEQRPACGECKTAAVCGAKGIGTLASRLEARRFAMDGEDGLRIGERVVIAYVDQTPVRASALAYAFPLAFSLVAAIAAQVAFGTDHLAFAAACLGLTIGFFLMKRIAVRLDVRGALEPRIVARLDARHGVRTGV